MYMYVCLPVVLPILNPFVTISVIAIATEAH